MVRTGCGPYKVPAMVNELSHFARSSDNTLMDVVIIGAGGHGRVVLDILRAEGAHRAVGFLDADPALEGQWVDGLKVLGPVNQLPKLRRQKIKGLIVGIGDNRTRLQYAQLVEQGGGFELINAIHPSAVLSPNVILGRNIVIAAGAVVSTSVRLSDSVIINTNAVVDHECLLAPGVHIAPAAVLAGRVSVGSGALIGLNATILPCLHIGEEATVGAGAVVINDVPAHATVVGVPARVIKPAPPSPPNAK